jgi:uncharacterized protein YecT (DUF1311 family)
MPDQVRHDEGEGMLTILIAAGIAAQPLDCTNAETQADMNECAARSARDSDAALNRIYPQIMRQVQAADRDAGNKEGEQRLRAAQRAWVAFRDAQCQLAGWEALGGSMESLLVSGCIAEMTDRRVSELQLMLAGR